MKDEKKTSTVADPFAPASRENAQGFFTRDFTARIERANAETESSAISMAISSEQPVERYDWDMDDYYLEVLSHKPGEVDLDYVRDGIPLLLDHRMGVQVGLGTTPVLGDDGLLRTEVTAGNHPDAAWVFADMLGGVRKKVSIGYWPGNDYVQEKDAASGMLRRTYRNWQLFEVSSVVVPADYGVGVGRGARDAASDMKRDHAVGAEPRTKESEMGEDELPVQGEALAREKTRTDGLTALVREWKDDASVGALVQSRLSEWLHEGTTVDAARTEVMRALADRATARPAVGGAVVGDMHERAEDRPWTADEFFRGVIGAAQRPETMDIRLRAQRSQNTTIGADGGFAVPGPVVSMLFEAGQPTGEILSRVTERPITVGNALKETLVDETSRVDGSRNGGLRAYWVAQEGEIPTTSAKVREVALNLKKVACAVPVTEEQIEDGPQLVSYLQEQVPAEMLFAKERAIWSGTGAGMPLGFLNSGAVVTVSIEGSQTIANTSEYIWQNAAKMVAALSPWRLQRAAFFINPVLWSRILTATAGAVSAGAIPVFTAPGQLASAPFGAIYGRPIVPVEYASAVGSLGDFVLADFSDYLWAQKGGVKFAQSMHVEFLKDKQTLRFTERVDGAPRTNKPLTPLTGVSADATSPYVILATRS